MIQLSKETLENFKKIFREEYGIDYSEEEAYKARYNLVGAFEWLLKQDMKQKSHLYKKINNDERGEVKILS